MYYPRVEIDLNKLRHNVRVLVNICKMHGIDVAGVTKVFCGDPHITKAYVEGGVKYLADSRIENLIKLKDIDLPKILIRIPMISEVDRVVEYADISLNSEIETIKAISNEAKKKGKIHNIILMVDLGDLREGYFNEEELYDVVEDVLDMDGIKLIGLGTNLTCYGGVIPDEDNLGRLVKIKKNIKEKFRVDLEIISGGNSSSLHLLMKEKTVDGINMLRLGEVLVLGRETAYGDKVKDTHDDCFQLVAEIVEIKEKPSVPIGQIGMDAFGNVPTFSDKGIRKRIICAIGKQDVDIDSIIPVDEDIDILGASSDHLILDGTDCKIDYRVGDKIRFNLTYSGILRVMTSEYVKKDIKN